MIENTDVTILGAGPAGISTAYHLREYGIRSVIYEKRSDFGGLCGSFEIDGFRFDRFAHLTFSKSPEVNALLEKKTDYLIHQPEAMNYYKGKWVRNPVQNNLYSLGTEEKISVIEDFVKRDVNLKVNNYGDWLRKNYGDYFTDNFTAKYTRKYWTVEPEQLEPVWVKNRMYTPTLREVLRGAFDDKTPNVHYSKEMHYPAVGGFKGFLEPLVENLDIRYQKTVEKIDFQNKIITFADGSSESYRKLVTTLPLCCLNEMDSGIPDDIKAAVEALDYTSGYMISIGLREYYEFPTIWFYIYDEELLPARVYFPNKKAKDNVPEGCCSMQAEVYVSKYRKLSMTDEEILENTIEQLSGMGLFSKRDVIVKDIRFEKYANIMFTPKIYDARKKVLDYLEENGVYCAGRFAQWDYLWLEQSLMSGKYVAEKISEEKL